MLDGGSTGDVGSTGLLEWLLALLPVLVLLLLVVSGRVKTTQAAIITLALALVIAAAAFGAGVDNLSVAIGKGLWTGVWILAVVWAALLLSAVSRSMGMADVGDFLSSLLHNRTGNILVMAWVFPSFVQGVAGFGTPIAIAAPILVSMGVRPAMAVALPLVGFHWSVGLGSVGSSFYMGALTADLSVEQTAVFSEATALLLGINAVVAGFLVAGMHGGLNGLREGWPVVLLVGPTMALAQFFVARLEPGIGALAGGAAGLVVVVALALLTSARRRRSAPTSATADQWPGEADPTASPRVDEDGAVLTVTAVRSGGARLLTALLPYLLLLVGVLAVLVPPPFRDWVRGHLTWGPSFPATSTSAGVAVDPVTGYQSFALLAHPGSFILVATVLSIVVWWLLGLWPRGSLATIVPSWLRSATKASWGVLLLATVATVMADSGMVRTLALGIAGATGDAYPAMAGLVGAVGSFTTGSTTNSNALFSALQADVAELIGVAPGLMVAAQTAGGNVGNALAPVIVLLGVTAVGAQEELRNVVRLVAGPAVVLLAVVAVTTVVVVRLA